MNNIIGPIAFALLAAIGNAMFAAGQKKAVEFDNSLAFIAIALFICITLIAVTVPLFGQPNYVSVLNKNASSAMLSGVGLYLTYLGFHVLYSKYGASNYVLYAVLSIITTSVFVGVIVFKETFNTYHWLALISSLATVVLFTIGNSMPKA